MTALLLLLLLPSNVLYVLYTRKPTRFMGESCAVSQSKYSRALRFPLQVMIPMRDGTHLSTQVDMPAFYKPGTKIAAVMERSPYGANAEELIADLFGEVLGYVSVRQDMRGTHASMSAGNFSCWHDSANDGYDTMAWIVNQTWSNGEVLFCRVSDSLFSHFDADDRWKYHSTPRLIAGLHLRCQRRLYRYVMTAKCGDSRY